MRNTIIILIISLIAVSCGKDKFTTAPQIKYKSVNPDRIGSDLLSTDPHPSLTLHVTDLEGDIGVKDTSISYLYVKHVGLNRIDSFPFPDIHSVTGRNFEADIIFDLFYALRPNPGNTTRPRTDTLFFEFYVKDFAKNKSNVVTNSNPFFYEIK